MKKTVILILGVITLAQFGCADKYRYYRVYPATTTPGQAVEMPDRTSPANYEAAGAN